MYYLELLWRGFSPGGISEVHLLAYLKISLVHVYLRFISGWGVLTEGGQTASARNWIDMRPIRGTKALWLAVWMPIQLMRVLVVLVLLNASSPKPAPHCNWLFCPGNQVVDGFNHTRGELWVGFPRRLCCIPGLQIQNSSRLSDVVRMRLAGCIIIYYYYCQHVLIFPRTSTFTKQPLLVFSLERKIHPEAAPHPPQCLLRLNYELCATSCSVEGK